MVPWANGLGTTSVVARHPDDDGWEWRLSLAGVGADGPFSSLPGVDRAVAVASGAGMTLSVGDDPPVRLTPTSDPVEFDGDASTTCVLIDGPIIDVNLMTRRGHATGSLVLRVLDSNDVLDLDAEATACVVLHGAVVVGADTLRRFDALLDPVDDTRLTATEPTRLALVVVRRL